MAKTKTFSAHQLGNMLLAGPDTSVIVGFNNLATKLELCTYEKDDVEWYTKGIKANWEEFTEEEVVKKDDGTTETKTHKKYRCIKSFDYVQISE